MKKALGASDTFFPVPAALVVSGTMDEPNIITVAWTGIMSSTPPTVAVSLRNTRFSLEKIRERGDFTVNIPPARLFKEVDYCGLVSGRDADKFAVTGLHAIESSLVGAPIIEECPYNMECRVTGEREIGQWVVLFAEIVETHCDEDKTDATGTRVDVSKADPLAYCAVVREYRELGRKLGDGFKAGNELKG
jgi:flavin reductase (DIM6/NTAB) family NADH-FMN oxidoreductase RutF